MFLGVYKMVFKMFSYLCGLLPLQHKIMFA
nr:MAG TPA: hypothetical protein [Caudoviricetes sp.]